MFRKLFVFAFAAQLLLVPSRLIAGGPPWLCVPIEGVTAVNAEACAALINAKLENKVWPQTGPYGGGAAIREEGDQRYLTFYLQEDVGLGEIEAALKGSEFSISRDKLRLFGHVILEIDAGKAPIKEILAALESIANVSVAMSENKKELFLVTAQIPYPVVKERPTPETVGWEKFAWNDYTSEQPTDSQSPISPQELPSYDTVRGVVARHKANLKDIHWSTTHACRALGCVSVPEAVVAAVSERTGPNNY